MAILPPIIFPLTALLPTRNGISTPLPAALATVSGKTLSVPLDLKSLATDQDDSVVITATLANAANAKVLTTPSYFLDLSFLATIKNYTSQLLSLQQTSQTLQTSLGQCTTNLSNAQMRVNPTTFSYRNPLLTAPDTVILWYTTDVYSTIQVTVQPGGQKISNSGTAHYIKISSLLPGTRYTFSAVVLDATSGNPLTNLSKQDTSLSTPPSVQFSPQFAVAQPRTHARQRHLPHPRQLSPDARPESGASLHLIPARPRHPSITASGDAFLAFLHQSAKRLVQLCRFP